MFRQMVVDSDDQNYQCIVWRFDPTAPILVYRLTTVTYGLICSLCLASRVLNQLANDYREKYPLGFSILSSEIYMDDVLSGGQTVNEVTEKRNQLFKISGEGGFAMRKWVVDDPEILTGLSDNLLASNMVDLKDHSLVTPV